MEWDVPQSAEVVTTADGAEWSWNLTNNNFPQSVQIVHWYHIIESMAHASEALYPKDEKAAQRAPQERGNALYLGQLDRIMASLEAAGLTYEAHYFQTHRRRMQYQEFRERGYPTGLGTVESGVKQFK